MRKLFVDTSGFVAVEDYSDQKHKEAKGFWQKLSSKPISIYTTNFIFDETYTLFLAKVNREAAIDFGTAIRESRTIQMVYVDEEIQNKAWEIAVKYQDKEFSFTDCVSFAVMEKLEIKEAFAFDEHFEQYGFKLYPS